MPRSPSCSSPSKRRSCRCAFEMCLGIPLFVGYVLSSLIVIPLVTHGITFISRFQFWTQPVWIVLHLIPFVYIAAADSASFERWTISRDSPAPDGQSFDLILFGTAATVVFSLIAQIGEQVDFLRFLPATRRNRQACLVGRLSGGRSGLDHSRHVEASRRIVSGVPRRRASWCRCRQAVEPTQMYLVAFRIRLFLAADGARFHRRLRRHLAAQDQRDQRLCGLDRVVEFLLASDAQPSRPRGVAGVQRDHRADADGTRHLQDARARSRALFDRRGLLGQRAGRRPRDQQAARTEPAGHRVQARASLRHQSGRRRRHAGGDGRRHRGVLRACSARRCSRCRRFVALLVAFVMAPVIAWATRGRFYIARTPRAELERQKM